MSLVDRIFRRGRTAQVDLLDLQAKLSAGVAWWYGRPADPALVRARLADGYRDAGVQPPTTGQLDYWVADLDEEAWNRLGTLTFALDLEDVRAALVTADRAKPVQDRLGDGFTSVALRTPNLTLELLVRSGLRVEELARHLVAGLGAGVRGESPQTSTERLQRINYDLLLAEAERANQSAAERLKELQRLQDDQENKVRRGKW